MDGNMATVPYIVWEAEKEMERRKQRREFVLKVTFLVLALLNNFAWLFARKKENGTKQDLAGHEPAPPV